MTEIKPTEIVLLLIAITVCLLAYLGKVSGEQFMAVVLLVLGYYYKDKSDQAVAEAVAKVGKIG